MDTGDPECECKVGRVMHARGLEGFNSEFRSAYIEGASLRDLRDRFNRAVIETAVTPEIDPGALDLDRIAAALRGGDDITPGERARVESTLRQAGVDLERLETELVSHMTVRTHLNGCLDVETSRESSISPDSALNTIEWARSRCRNVITETVKRATSAGVVSVSTPEVTVSIRIACEDCGETYRPRQLLAAGACGC